MYYAKLTDHNDRENNCLARFETESARDDWCEKYTDYYNMMIWVPKSETEAYASYDMSKFTADDYGDHPCYEIGRDCEDHIVFAISV